MNHFLRYFSTAMNLPKTYESQCILAKIKEFSSQTKFPAVMPFINPEWQSYFIGDKFDIWLECKTLVTSQRCP